MTVHTSAHGYVAFAKELVALRHLAVAILAVVAIQMGAMAELHIL